MLGRFLLYKKLMEVSQDESPKKKKRYPYHKKYIKTGARGAVGGAVIGGALKHKHAAETAIKAYKNTGDAKLALHFFRSHRPPIKAAGKYALAGAGIGALTNIGAKALEKHRNKVKVLKKMASTKHYYDSI